MTTYRLRALFDLGVQGELAGFHVDLEPGSDSAQAAQALLSLDAVWDWWNDNGAGSGIPARALWTGDVKLTKVTFQKIAPSPVGFVFNDTRVAVGGTQAGQAMTPQVALVASYLTAENSRRGRGRSYFPPPPESSTQVGGDIGNVESYAIAAKDLAVRLESPAYLAVGTVSLNHVVYSSVDGLNRAVTTYRVGRRVDTQRKRLGKEQTYDVAP